MHSGVAWCASTAAGSRSLARPAAAFFGAVGNDQPIPSRPRLRRRRARQGVALRLARQIDHHVDPVLALLAAQREHLVVTGVAHLHVAAVLAVPQRRIVFLEFEQHRVERRVAVLLPLQHVFFEECEPLVEAGLLAAVDQRHAGKGGGQHRHRPPGRAVQLGVAGRTASIVRRTASFWIADVVKIYTIKCWRANTS
jgi:hypothetical protein